MERFKKHVFICTNLRENQSKACCAKSGGVELREQFKRRLKQRGLHTDVRANKSGCLDYCQYGVAMVIYPQQIWYGGVKLEDIDEIIEKSIIGDEVIDRLLIKK